MRAGQQEARPRRRHEVEFEGGETIEIRSDGHDHRFGGHPLQIQGGDMQTECALVSKRLDLGDGTKWNSKAAKRLKSDRMVMITASVGILFRFRAATCRPNARWSARGSTSATARSGIRRRRND